MMRISLLKPLKLMALTLIPLAALLSACSGHPAAGNWLVAKDADGQRDISALSLSFDGKAEMFLTAENQPALRCRWHGRAADAAQISCRSGRDGKDEHQQHFLLAIAEHTTDLSAQLFRADAQGRKQGKALADLTRQP